LIKIDAEKLKNGDS